MKKLGFVVLLWSVLQGGAWAGIDESLAAAERGDYATALRELQPLARAGDSDAQFALGNMYADGRGVPKSDVEAVKWYRRAADQGKANAQNNLGAMYAEGQGVTANKVIAYVLFNLAAVNPSNEINAPRNRDRIEQQLTLAQRTAGQAISLKLQQSDDFLRTLDEAVRQTSK